MVSYVVNRHGAIHSVPDNLVEALLAQGFRQATAEEIARWYREQGLEVPYGSADDDGDADQRSEDTDGGVGQHAGRPGRAGRTRPHS